MFCGSVARLWEDPSRLVRLALQNPGFVFSCPVNEKNPGFNFFLVRVGRSCKKPGFWEPKSVEWRNRHSTLFGSKNLGFWNTQILRRFEIHCSFIKVLNQFEYHIHYLKMLPVLWWANRIQRNKREFQRVCVKHWLFGFNRQWLQ
jgi:hypothetical protein